MGYLEGAGIKREKGSIKRERGSETWPSEHSLLFHHSNILKNEPIYAIPMKQKNISLLNIKSMFCQYKH